MVYTRRGAPAVFRFTLLFTSENMLNGPTGISFPTIVYTTRYGLHASRCTCSVQVHTTVYIRKYAKRSNRNLFPDCCLRHAVLLTRVANLEGTGTCGTGGRRQCGKSARLSRKYAAHTVHTRAHYRTLTTTRSSACRGRGTLQIFTR
ncbi:hypothetical protein J6590_010147 [Homalodisca vitripennis]|nr:hypothetical protein J6590_010147 [Homalodisca vitripennis]